jgi:hypothetical protein
MELLLARLFADCDAVERFLANREAYARHFGLTATQLADLSTIDAASLRFAARSFARKRASRGDSS